MVQVKVTEGILEGEIEENSLDGKYYSFKGIPYAEPPIGNLRFKAPKPPRSWSGVRSAKEHGPVCYQYDSFTQSIVEGSEDCLYLNIYSSHINPSKKLPVMVWIHGGSYMSGSGNSSFYGPDFILKHGVVLVTFNYRLEILGFLCLHTKDIPGNAGMKDQVAALSWVQKNISNFGGDPNNVTIFGESAGAGSVSYHLISPMSRGLFKRAIIQSGSSNCRWARAYEPRQRALTLAKQLGEESEDDEKLYNFFNNLPVESLVKRKVPIVVNEIMQPNINLHFSIVDEKEYDNGNERFFYGDLFERIQYGIDDGIEIMIGYTADEGYLAFAKSPLDNIIRNYNSYLEFFVPLELVYNCSITKQLEIGRKVKQFYYGKENVTRDNLEPLVKFFSFSTFTFDIIQWVKFCSKENSNKIFLYKFNGISERNVMSEILGARADILNRPIVCHADDLLYLFEIKVKEVPIHKSLESIKLINNITKLWTNFAKYGNPTPDIDDTVRWENFTLDNEAYLDIADELVMKSSPDNEELKFWESIYKQYFPSNVAIV